MQTGAGTEFTCPRRSQHDLRDRETVRRYLEATQPDYLIHLAANVGGIGANLDNPGSFFYDNAVMGIQLLEEARRAGVKKVLVVGTACSYPGDAPVPTAESALWNGYPEPTNAPYGLAKLVLLAQAQAYRQQYGMNIHLRDADESLWARGQLQPGYQPRDPRPHPEIRRGR